MNGLIGGTGVWVEVSDDRYCEPVQRSFKRASEVRMVLAVDLDGTGAQPVRGLASTPDGKIFYTPAYACQVEDSGSGLVWLVYGGSAGLWVGPGDDAGSAQAATFEAYLLVDADALEFAESA